jgi:endonuclease III
MHPPNPAKRNLHKATAIAAALEEHMGKPVIPKRKARPLDSLIATLLSQNTNDRNSYRAWLNLKRQFPTWELVLAASHRSLAKAIEIGGLKNQKAERITLILRTLLSERGRLSLDFLKKMPDEDAMQYLLGMKGVGSKTAACVLVFSLGRDVFPVDTHIHRICNRLGLVRTNSADATFDAMKSQVAHGRAYSFHVNLIRFGRQVCRAANPLCGHCPLFDDCVYPQKHRYLRRNSSLRMQDAASDFLITEQIANGHSKRNA